ncbi:DUF1275 family protein [Thiocapsa sp.]|uniref:DUF1275 family protein n=1 Tax=Thiocapsa sp. TaxID=2024551 RepID=UPI003593A6C6
MSWRSEISPLILTLAAAGVDAMVILGFNVLTAAQTGNTVLLAVAVARGDAETGLSAAVSVAAFVVGAVAGEILCGWSTSGHRREPGILPALLIEVLLLISLLVLWLPAEPTAGLSGVAVVALAALAMGVQSAAVLRLQGPSTTYITGMLATFSTGYVRWIRAGRIRRTRCRSAESDAQPPDRLPWRNGLIWVVYLGGAILCGILFLRSGVLALLVPIAAICVVIAIQVSAPD